VSDLRPRLDRLVPELPGEGNWEQVLADAKPSQRRHLSLALPLVAAAAGVAILALAWPFGSERSGGVLDRALAAIGEGPVLHIVYRGEWGPTLVELSSGKVTPVVAESELWYDPKRGLSYVSRLGGEVRSEHLVPPRRVSARQENELLALADHYRSALQSGKARVIGNGRVAGRPVLWIRIRAEWLPDAGDGRRHLFAEEVAVDRDTSEPVYARWTRDGRPHAGDGQTIVKLERVSADAVDFEARERASRSSIYAGAETGRDIPRRELRRLFGEPAIWLGPAHDGKPLTQTQELLFKYKEKKDDEWQTARGATLYYGQLRPERFGFRPRDHKKPYVLLTEAKEVSPMWQAAAGGADVPEGSIRIDAVRAGFLRRGGVYVSINAKTTREVLKAAVALRPFGAAAPAPSDLDFDRIAQEVDARRGHLTEVSGARPVAPRPIVLRRGKLVQTASAKGIVVRVFSRGVIRFDTRALEDSVERVVPSELSWHCFRLRNGEPTGWGGGYGSIPRNGIKSVAVLGHMPRGRRVALRPPFDACELGTGFGRNWLRRFAFHGMLEIALTRRGTRYFEERAAARELGHFVRTGRRQAARKRMRAGGPAPAAKELYDRARPYIAVASGGDRFRASLRASTGRWFFVEIVRGRVHRTNAKRLAAAYLK
jgi:hypothetical protein